MTVPNRKFLNLYWFDNDYRLDFGFWTPKLDAIKWREILFLKKKKFRQNYPSDPRTNSETTNRKLNVFDKLEQVFQVFFLFICFVIVFIQKWKTWLVEKFRIPSFQNWWLDLVESKIVLEFQIVRKICLLYSEVRVWKGIFLECEIHLCYLLGQHCWLFYLVGH